MPNDPTLPAYVPPRIARLEHALRSLPISPDEWAAYMRFLDVLPSQSGNMQMWTLDDVTGAVPSIVPFDPVTRQPDRPWPHVVVVDLLTASTPPPPAVNGLPLVPTPDTFPLRSGPPADDVQGNVLEPFRKPVQYTLLMTFRVAQDPATTRAGLKRLLPHLSTTREVASFNARARIFESDPRVVQTENPKGLHVVWISLSLTSSGLRRIAEGLGDPVGDLNRAGFSAFMGNGGNRLAQIGDVTGEVAFEGVAPSDVDAILTVAGDDAAEVATRVSQIWAVAVSEFEMTVRLALRGEDVNRDSLGFASRGIPRDPILGFDVPEPGPQESGEPIDPTAVAPGEILLGQRDGFGGVRPVPTWMRNGSFHVLSRFAIQPNKWTEATNVIARELDSAHADEANVQALAKAKLVGRWPSGASLAANPTVDPAQPDKNNAGLDKWINDDPAGAVTPKFAHIRKMNPRRTGRGARRIARRGMPYSTRNVFTTREAVPAAGTGDNVGVLFNAYMSDIEAQFEAMLRNARDPAAPFDQADPPGADPLVATNSAGTSVDLEAAGGIHKVTLPNISKMDGLVYAFTPSLSMLHDLADGTALQP